MINLNFAPNENFKDALISFSLIFQPWNWQKPLDLKTKKEILNRLGLKINSDFFPFFTGRSAWFHFLKSLNFPPKSEVAIQGFTCEAVVLPILTNNLKPIYVDIENKTYSMDFFDLLKKITPKTKVILLQHTFGLTPLYREKILSFAEKNGLLLAEDLAHGFNQKIFSSTKNGNFLFSFGRSKVFSSVFGGAIVTSDKKIGKRLKEEEKSLSFPSKITIFKILFYKPLAVLIKKTYKISLGKLIHYWAKKIGFLIPEVTEKEKRGFYNFDFDKIYPLVLGKLLLSQLKRKKEIEKKRQVITEFYNQSFGLNYQSENGLLRYPLRVKNPEEIKRKLAKKGIFLGTWYNQIVAPKGVNLKKMKYEPKSCPQAEKICREIINLPTNISLKEAEKIVKLINGN
ncbi:MAG: DegT/DnrJ/EryC1/StrS family aminotransferase [Microgenomates group bacterium]